MATVRRISPGSVLKVGFVVYASFGLLVGACTSAFSMMLGSLGGGLPGSTAGARAIGFGFGAGAIIILPIAYGILGAIGGAISAAVYNLAAGWVGGIEVDIG